MINLSQILPTRLTYTCILILMIGLGFSLSTNAVHALGKKANENEINLNQDNISIRYDENKAFIAYTFPYAKGDVLFATKVILGRKKKDGSMARLTFQYQPIVNVSTTDFNQLKNHTIEWELPRSEFEHYLSKRLDTYIRNLSPIKLTAEHVAVIKKWAQSSQDASP